MTLDSAVDALARELNGCFGDLAWAFSPGLPHPGFDGVFALVPADEGEIAGQRLLLAGYERLKSAGGAERWRTQSGLEFALVRTSARWLYPGLMAASRNRNRAGTPQLPPEYAAVAMLDVNPGLSFEGLPLELREAVSCLLGATPPGNR